MDIKQITVSSLINKITGKDSLFQGSYTIDPYQNCSYGCVYCDSTYDNTIYVKQNAIDILKNEIKTISKKRIIIGSVHDPYQECEKKYQLTRSIISFLTDYDYPIHILTKSSLILRDIDILTKNKQVLVTFSFISPDPQIVSTIEKNFPPIETRFKALQELVKNNITAGTALIPILPGLIENDLENIIKMAKSFHSTYFLSKHLFLKGDQKNIYFDFLLNNYPNLIDLYRELFSESIYPPMSYQNKINKKIKKICGRFHLPTSISRSKF